MVQGLGFSKQGGVIPLQSCSLDIPTDFSVNIPCILVLSREHCAVSVFLHIWLLAFKHNISLVQHHFEPWQHDSSRQQGTIVVHGSHEIYRYAQQLQSVFCVTICHAIIMSCCKEDHQPAGITGAVALRKPCSKCYIFHS